MSAPQPRSPWDLRLRQNPTFALELKTSKMGSKWTSSIFFTDQLPWTGSKDRFEPNLPYAVPDATGRGQHKLIS